MKVNEIFYSLQGEGRWAGIPMIFIRTTGCNLRCSFCDTTYAYEKGTEMMSDELIGNLQDYPCQFVCLTGGEPLLQKDIETVIHALFKKKYTILLETNGSLIIKKFTGKKSLVLSLDIKCPSYRTVTSEIHLRK